VSAHLRKRAATPRRILPRATLPMACPRYLNAQAADLMRELLSSVVSLVPETPTGLKIQLTCRGMMPLFANTTPPMNWP
jgi:hypothetical protein